MLNPSSKDLKIDSKVKPACPVFGLCGGCAHQDIPYDEELAIKEADLKELLMSSLQLHEETFDSIVASPTDYHYRHRLDLSLRRTREGNFLIGFMSEGHSKVVPIESCAIARKELSQFLPELKTQAIARLPPDYRMASLVVKTGEDGRVLWGGIGRGSLNLPEPEYLWTEVCGKRIFYSLDTFFQANLSILSLLIERIRSIVDLDHQTVFFDLYGGVGLFSILLADQIGQVVLIEESAPSVKVAQFNVAYHHLNNVEIYAGKVEDQLDPVLEGKSFEKSVAFIDPPRKGLSFEAREAIGKNRAIKTVLYLSCNPESLAVDLHNFVKMGWRIERIIPFDFFPKTKHLEVLTLMKYVD
jgi:tRNA/tmRNA/rRNA uracil-C5-methylase (TrmA/RlmC/RlmD family)